LVEGSFLCGAHEEEVVPQVLVDRLEEFV
jgi:hypothetical protein